MWTSGLFHRRQGLPALLAIASFGPLVAAQPSYTALDLGTIPGAQGNSWAWDINELGEVVGYADAPNGLSIHAFLFDGDVTIDLGTLGATYSWAFGINNSTQITGYSGVNSITIHGFLWEAGVMHDIGSLPGSRGSFSRGNAINEDGVITGACHGTGPGMVVPYAGFLYDDGAWTEIPTFGGNESQSYAINDHGEAVGFARYESPNAAPRAFLFRDPELFDLGTLGGTMSQASGINNRREIVGWSTNAEGFMRPFLWRDGEMLDLGDLGGNAGWAYGINHRGQIVGRTTLADGAEHGFLIDGDAMWDVNDLVQPGLDVTFHGARAINEVGQIVNTGTQADGVKRAYLLTPDHLMKLRDPVPGVAGEVNSITVSNGAPGQRVLFLHGSGAGVTEAPWCGVNVSIARPRLAGFAMADSHGVATLTSFVPPAARDAVIFVQAIQFDSCRLSNLIRFTFN